MICISILFFLSNNVFKHAFTCEHIMELITLKQMIIYLNLDQNQFYK